MKNIKPKVQFICSECGESSPKWQGQCSACGKWNSIVESVVSKPGYFKAGYFKQTKAEKLKPLLLNTKKYKPEIRKSTGIKELDRVLGGGLVSGSYILLGGAPGIGKSTLLLHTAEGLAEKNLKVFYVSAEESLEQTSLRAKRLNLKNQNNIFMLNESSLENIFHHVKQLKPNVLIVDSIQTVELSDLASAPGSVSQVRECSSQLMNFAKSTNTTVFIVGHITKEGELAGPRILEHTVDTVLSFDGDPHYQFRLLRVLKNRFGTVNEIGVFQMLSEGLREVANPSEFFLEEKQENLIGSVVFTAMEGSRPILCEVQALCLRTYLAMPRRTAIGLDINRLHKVIAVLDSYLKTGLYQYDVFINIAGGLKIREPALDMAIVSALLSAKKQKPILKKSCFFGEIGLTGRVRASTFAEERIKSAQKLGFKNIYLPEGNKKLLKKNQAIDTLTLNGIQSVKNLSQIF